jgi:hypothetical protein
MPHKEPPQKVAFERPLPAQMMAIDGTWRRCCAIKDISDQGATLGADPAARADLLTDRRETENKERTSEHNENARGSPDHPRANECHAQPNNTDHRLNCGQYGWCVSHRHRDNLVEMRPGGKALGEG